MPGPRIVYPSGKRSLVAAYDGGRDVELYDLMFLDGDDAKPASAQGDAGSEARNQRTFARRFLGVAGEAKLEADAAGGIKILTDVQAELDCESSAWEVGDLVTVAESAGGTELEDRKLVKTSDPDTAIGVCLERSATAATRVQVRLVSNVARERSEPAASLFGGSSHTETLAGTKTLVVGDARIQSLDPGGAGRDVVLPAEELSAGLSFWIANTADAAETLTIKDDGGSTICTPGQNESAVLVCDGTSWRGLIGASN